MTVNPYFNEFKVKSEQDLVEDVIIEAIQAAGVDVLYIHRNMLAVDEILNENILARFENATPIEMYVNNSNDYGGSGFFQQNFGTIIDRTMDFSVSKKRFKEVIGIPAPKEGDLLYIPFNNMIVQIDYVEYETNFYNLQKNYIYELKCSIYTANYDNFNTGVAAIDSEMAAHNLANDRAETNTDTTEGYGDNTQIQEEADGILDFSETNPLGGL